MPQLVAVAIEYIGAELYAYQIGATLIQYSTVIAYATVAAGTYAAARSMQKMPNLGGLQSEVSGRMSMIRDTVASRRVIYGTVRVSGPIIFASTTSNANSTKNENLHMVLALAGHQCGGLKGVFLNDVRAVDETGTIQSPFTGNYEYSFKFGTPTQTAFVMDDPAWTSDHKLSGICALYSRMVANPNIFPNGIPNITAVVQGYDVPDMNDNPIAGCTNPALILRHYLLNYFKCDANEIDTDSFTTAAGICDEVPSGFAEKRYECNYTFTLNTKPQKVIEDILKTCYGKLAYVNGKFVLKVGAYTSPVMSINEDDIIGTINVTTKSSQANAINSVKGTFVDGLGYTSSFQPADFVPVTSSYYLAEDNNFENPYEIELAGITNHTQARRIAKITLLDSRQDLSVNLSCKIGALRLIAGDTVYVSLNRYGWTNKVFQVIEMTINSDLSVGLVLKETASEIYDFPIGEDVDRDLSPNTNLPNPFIVPAPVGFSAIESTIRDKDGTIFPSVTLNWSASLSGSIDENEIDYRDTASLAYTSLGTFSRIISEASTLDVTAGHTYDFRIRSLNYLGTYSPYASASIKVLGNTLAPHAPSNIQIVGATASLYLKWVNDPTDTDYQSTRVFLGTSGVFASAEDQGTVSGTSWNKSISGEGYYWAWLQNINTSQITSSIVAAGTSVYVHAYDFSGSMSGSQGPSGSKGDTNYNIYKRSTLVPSTPTGNLTPTGWSLTIPADDGNALWVSTGLISGADGLTLIGSWSTPQRLSGKASYYQTSAPVSGVDASPVIGDLWFDTDDAFKVYRWNGSSWVSVQDGNIAPLSSSIVSMTSSIVSITNDVNNVANGLINATASISNLYTQSYALSSSYYASSASFSSSIGNIQLTYASKDFAISVSAFSSSAAYNSATGSAYSYTDNKLINYATKDQAVAISAYSASVAVNTATGSSNAYTDNRLTIYATTSSAQAYANTAGTASYNAATASFNETLTSYATQTYAQSIANTTVSAAITSSVNSGIISASVAVTAKAVADLSGSVAGEYVVAVTGGNRVAGFKILSSTVSSSFDVQADRFRIYNNNNGTVTQSFLADANGVYIDQATIRSLDAGKITAGTITAAIRMTAGEITGSGYCVTSAVGIRADDDASLITLTGGSDNGASHGAQVDLLGINAGSAGSKGTLVLSAANVGTTTGDGTIRFRTSDTEQGTVKRDGTFAWNGAISANSLACGNINGNGVNSDSIEVGYYGSGNRDCYIDFHSSGTSASPDYNFRIIRESGANGSAGFLQTGNGNVYFATSGTGTYTFDANVEATSYSIASSRRYKTNIISFTKSLDIIKQIEPKQFDYINGSKKNEIGLIAEELNEILPNLVHKNQLGEPEGVDYGRLTPVLLGAIKEQQAIIEDLQNRLSKLENKK